MNDLISRRVLVEDIRNRIYINKALAEIFETVIDSQPTVFDMDKVVERLRKEIGDCECESCDRHTDCDTCRAEKAVEIVRTGGVNG